MAVVEIKNPSLSENVKSLISLDYSSGATLNVESSTGFANGNYIVVGEPGMDKTEITYLTATPPTDTTLTINPLKFPHAKGTPIYFTRWDKFSLEYKTTSGGGFAVYGSMPTALNFDALSSDYRDEGASDTYYWRYRYYSSELSAYSGYSDTIAASGWSKNAVGYMVKNVRKIANDPDGKTVTDTEITRFFNAGQGVIYSLYDRWWFLFKSGDVINTVTSTKSYALPSDFGRMHSVLYRYVSSPTDITYNLKYVTMIEFDYENQDNTVTDDDYLKHYTLMPGDSTSPTGYLKVCTDGGAAPATAGLDLTPRYYKTFTDLDSFGDATEVPIPEMLENYALAQIFKIRKDEDKASYYDKLFREQVELLKFMQKKQVVQNRTLLSFKGRNASSRLYGTRNLNQDVQRENYW